jgi:hypothetical protein
MWTLRGGTDLTFPEYFFSACDLGYIHVAKIALTTKLHQDQDVNIMCVRCTSLHVIHWDLTLEDIFCSNKLQYSQRHTMINHCDRRITHLSDTDIYFVLFNIPSKFLLYLECYLLSPKMHKKVSK